VAVSENGILLDGNLCLAEIHGYRLEEMIGRPVADFVAPESRALVARRCDDDFREAYEYSALHKDGSVFPAEAHGRTKVWQGRTTRMTALRDLTLAKQAEAELQARQSELEHAQQLALVSEISAGIIHQLAQPLSAMGANVFSAISTLDKRALSTAEMLDVLTDIQDGVGNMRDIVIHLRALTNPQKSDRVAMDLNAILQKVLPLVRAKAASHRARIELDLAPDLPPVQADLVQLGQVILNLSRNALEACHDCPPERRVVAISTREIPGEQVELCVRDAGTGIAPETMDRLFTPFFSTKPDGLGVGLRLSQTIVRSHCGTITAENNAGGFGAAFRVTLPATSGDKGSVLEW
jgi:two-component system sensor kinase FixL